MSVSEGKLNRHDTVVRTTDLLSTTIDGQVVVTSIEKGNYIGLEGAGNHIWSLVEKPIRISSLCDTLQDEFDVSPEQCEEDVITFMERLRENGLVEIRDTDTAQ